MKPAKNSLVMKRRGSNTVGSTASRKPAASTVRRCRRLRKS